MQIDGAELPNLRTQEGVFSPESKKIITTLNECVDPLIKRITDPRYTRAEAERLIVLSCVRRSGESKTFLHNYCKIQYLKTKYH